MMHFLAEAVYLSALHAPILVMQPLVHDASFEQAVRHSHVEERYRRAVLFYIRTQFFSAFRIKRAFDYGGDSCTCREVEMAVNDVFVKYFRFQHSFTVITHRGNIR